jgi:glycosyltransferase involved in cell wall biosynthesis
VQFFYDGQGADLHALWQAARRMALLAHLSLVPPRMVGRELLQSVDLLIEPQAPGAVRVMTLAAMAHGVPVLAQRDPWLDYLRHQETAVVLEAPDAAAWGTWLRRFLDDPGYFQALAGRARLWVRTQHNMESHVAQLMGLYKRLAGEAIPFPGR